MKPTNNYIMRLFLIILILIFGLQSWTKADDIRDFEIEGMSIGDSLLDYMSEEEINDAERNATKMKEEFLIIWYNSPSLYDDVSITYRVKDKKYIIHSIMAMLDFDKNITRRILKNFIFFNNFISFKEWISN